MLGVLVVGFCGFLSFCVGVCGFLAGVLLAVVVLVLFFVLVRRVRRCVYLRVFLLGVGVCRGVARRFINWIYALHT
jgi:hypothetical protein